MAHAYDPNTKVPGGRTIQEFLRSSSVPSGPKTGYQNSSTVFSRLGTTGYFTPEMLAAQDLRQELANSGILGKHANNRMINPTRAMGTRLSARQVRRVVQLWEDPAFVVDLTKGRAGQGGPQSYYDPDRGESYTNRAAVPVKPGVSGTRTSPSPLTDIPTTTINPMRPRTVAAGWEAENERSVFGTLTVVFRDGTYYNYYDVPQMVWESFKGASSKGRFIKSNLDGQYPRGVADIAGFDARVRALLYRYSATAQGFMRGKQYKPRSHKKKK